MTPTDPEQRDGVNRRVPVSHESGLVRGRCRDALVWDNHGCMPVNRPHDTSFLPQLARYRAAGVDVVMLNVGFGDMGVEQHVRTLASLRGWLLRYPGDYVLVETADDIERARSTGRLAVGFDIEGANAIDDQLSLVQLYYDLGVRWMSLAYNANNRVGGGCQDADIGLTTFGRAVVREMERVGMVVCCSHTGYRTAREVMEMASKPVIFSHSNPSAVQAHSRNIPDSLIRACADTGGVVGINGIGPFLGDNDNSAARYAHHVDHVAQLVGAEHVAVALDYVFDTKELDDYVASQPHLFPPELGYAQGIRMVAPEQLAEVIEVLWSWGYRDEDVKAVLGGNLLRLARTVWKPGGSRA